MIIEMNGYPPSVDVPPLSQKGAEVNNPVMFKEGINPFIGNASIQNVPVYKSKNFIPNVSGWALFEDGTAEINQAAIITDNFIVSTNFRKLITEKNTGISIWVSNGTTPNGNLTGVEGDICLNSSATGQLFYCTATGTTWSVV